jgi:hypothetical protein
MSKQYVIVCAPAGTSLTQSVIKLRDALGGAEAVETADVEWELRHLPETAKDLLKAGRKVESSKVTMHDITFYLPRDNVISLANMGLLNALKKLEDSDKTYLVLSCHLTYFGSKRFEFYTGIDPKLLSKELKPARLLLIIDDIYDMYVRLSNNVEQFFSLESAVRSTLATIQKEEEIELESLEDDDLVALCLAEKLGMMTHLLSWRHLETVVAEGVARQIGCPFMVYGTKQTIASAASWLRGVQPTQVYTSHPISRVRREFRKSGNWGEIPEQIFRFHQLLLEDNVVVLMPTAIDERRIKRGDGAPLKRMHPELEARWPSPRPVEASLLLYTPPSGESDWEHTKILRYETWNHKERVLQPVTTTSPKADDKSNVLLREFERQCERALAARDYLLVSTAKTIVVFRPFMQVPSGPREGLSRALSQELGLWELVAKSHPPKTKEDLAAAPKALFIHLKKDVDSWREYYDSGEPQSFRSSQERERVVELVAELHSLTLKLARELLDDLDLDKDNFFSQGSVPKSKADQVRRELPALLAQAHEEWENYQLSGAVLRYFRLTPTDEVFVQPEQVHLIIANDMEEVERRRREIADFLIRGLKPPPLGTLALNALRSFGDTVSLKTTRIVGNYYRFSPEARKMLSYLRDQIEDPLRDKNVPCTNFLIWGASSSGKTSFVEEIAEDLKPLGIKSKVLNVANLKNKEADLKQELTELDATPEPMICLIDEITTPHAEWPLNTLFPFLLPSTQYPNRRAVFVVAGSRGKSLEELTTEIKELCPKQPTDLLNRTPHQFGFPPPQIEDSVLIFAGKVKVAFPSVDQIEKACLFYVLMERPTGHLIRDLVSGLIPKFSTSSTTLCLDDILSLESPVRSEFLAKYQAQLDQLSGSYVHIES